MPVCSPDNHETPLPSMVYKVNHLSSPVAGLRLGRVLTFLHLKYPALLLGSIF